MYQKTTINKEQFKKIILHAINGDTDFVAGLEKNKSWLERPEITSKNTGMWMGRNEQIFDIGASAVKVDRSKDTEHFVTVANSKLQLL